MIKTILCMDPAAADPKPFDFFADYGTGVCRHVTGTYNSATRVATIATDVNSPMSSTSGGVVAADSIAATNSVFAALATTSPLYTPCINAINEKITWPR